MRLDRLARPGGAGGGGDHRFGLDQARAVRGEEGERDGSRITAGHRDPPGALQRGAGAGQFGQAVGPGAGVGGAVERLPVGGVPQPEVRAHVHDEHIVTEPLGDGGGLSVGQGEKDHVVPGEHIGGGRLQNTVGQRPEVRLKGAEALAGVGVPGEGADLDAGVPQEQPEQFPTGVSTGSRHRCTYYHRSPPRRWHDYT